MPELPEVETIRRDLAEQIIHKKIQDVAVLKQRLVKQSITLFKNELINDAIKKADRIGKLLGFELNSGKRLLIHLKMTGQLIYQKGNKTVAGGHSFKSGENIYPNKYTYITITFADHSQLFFNDMRQFGYMQVVDQTEWERVLEKYGIEPLQKDFTFENFASALGKRTTTIKAALLNQQLFAGIGNIYADEICFAARVLPDRRVNTLTDVEKKALYTASKKVIAKAVQERGTTFNDYKDAFGRIGNFTRHLQVFARTGEKCKRCGKGVIQKTRVAGRGTHFCFECQK